MDGSTLLAGIIGAVGSIAGGYWAQNVSIKAQEKLQIQRINYENDLEVKNQIKSAKIIEYDILTAISEAIRVSNGLNSPSWGSTPSSLSFNADYNIHINNISDKLTLASVINLNKLYGLFKMYQESTFRYTIGYSEIRTHLIHIGTEMFGGQFAVISININYLQFTKKSVVDLMIQEYSRLFSELSTLTEQN